MERYGTKRLAAKDISSGRRGGLRSHSGSRGRSRDQLYEEVTDLRIEGPSKVNKEQLRRAVDAKKGRRSC